MPQIKSAKKKLRQDKKHTKQNLLVKKSVRAAVLAFKRKPTFAALSKVFAVFDSAAKKKVLHANKAARLKSRLSKLLLRKLKMTDVKSEVAAKSKSPRKKKISV